MKQRSFFFVRHVLLALCSIISCVHGFTPLSVPEQQNVRTLLNVLDKSVRVYIDLEEVDPAPVVAACRAVCCALPGGSKKENEQEDEAITTHFFGVRLWDTNAELVASNSSFVHVADRDDKFSERLMEVADIVTASAEFVLLPLQTKAKALDTLDAVLSHKRFIDARRMALVACKKQSKVDDDTITDKDKRVVNVLYTCVLENLGPHLLRPLGFPCTKSGLRGFVAAARSATNTQRAAAALGRTWHAATEVGPLILVPPNQDDAVANAYDTKTGGSLEDCTLVIAFSALGWNGIVRPEWGGTLQSGALSSGVVVIAHALDSCKSWFTTNPMTGAHDNGAWWDDSLAKLSAPFGRVCIVGESMGGTAALRFARHATKCGTVVSLVPQINLEDFTYCNNVRNDLKTGRLLKSIQHATETTSAARVAIHVGRNRNDLGQLKYLHDTVTHEHALLGLEVDAPLPRGDAMSHAVSNCRLQVVKHDVEGHALGAGLKAKGILRETVLDDLLGTSAWQSSSSSSSALVSELA